MSAESWSGAEHVHQRQHRQWWFDEGTFKCRAEMLHICNCHDRGLWFPIEMFDLILGACHQLRGESRVGGCVACSWGGAGKRMTANGAAVSLNEELGRRTEQSSDEEPVVGAEGCTQAQENAVHVEWLSRAHLNVSRDHCLVKVATTHRIARSHHCCKVRVDRSEWLDGK
jgi:hypothetical protein